MRQGLGACAACMAWMSARSSQPPFGKRPRKRVCQGPADKGSQAHGTPQQPAAAVSPRCVHACTSVCAMPPCAWLPDRASACLLFSCMGGMRSCLSERQGATQASGLPAQTAALLRCMALCRRAFLMAVDGGVGRGGLASSCAPTCCAQKRYFQTRKRPLSALPVRSSRIFGRSSRRFVFGSVAEAQRPFSKGNS